jgi:hypothetical protein
MKILHKINSKAKKRRITGLFTLRRSSGSGFRSPRSFRVVFDPGEIGKRGD